MLVTEEENQPSKQHPNTNTPKTLLKIKIKIRITIFFHAKTTKTAIASGHIGKPHQCEKCLFKKTETNNNFWKVFYWLFNKYYTSQYCIFVQNNKRFNKHKLTDKNRTKRIKSVSWLASRSFFLYGTVTSSFSWLWVLTFVELQSHPRQGRYSAPSIYFLSKKLSIFR